MATVLLIDDEADLRTLARMSLELDGHRIDEAGNGRQGLDLIRTHAGDDDVIVVLDVQMPELDGWETLRLLRSDSSLDGVAVLLCTVRAESVDQERGYAAGADAYLAKPFDLAELHRTVDALVGLDAAALAARRAELQAFVAGSTTESSPDH